MAKIKPIEKPVFNPEKSYQWDPKDEFTLTGMQFSAVFNIFKEMALSRQPIPPKAIVDAYNELSGILQQGYEQGVVKDYTPPAPPQPTLPTAQ